MKSITFLIKPVSSLCNIRCKYCFYANEAQNREIKNYGTMTLKTADKLIQEAVNATDKNSSIIFAFQGGEPTLAGLDFYKHFIEEEKKYSSRSFYHSIQTNAYNLNEDWASFFKENDFLVGVSVDGYEKLHNINRVTASEKGTFDRVIKNIELLKKHAVAINALCVVTKQATVKPHKVYNKLKELGFKDLQFIACLDPIEKQRGQEQYSLTADEYARFLCAVFDNWYRDWKNDCYTSVRLFEDYIHLLVGRKPSTCAATGKCGSYLVVEADGSLFPCDFYVLDPWKLGNIHTISALQAIESKISAQFQEEGNKRPAKCKDCKWECLCHGGCMRDLVQTEAGTGNYYCKTYKFFFEYSYERLIEIAKNEATLTQVFMS